MNNKYKQLQNELSSSPDWALGISPTGLNMPEVEQDQTDGRHFLVASAKDDEDYTDDEEFEVSKRLTDSSQGPITEDYTLEFFRPLQQTDVKARLEALNMIVELLRASMDTEEKKLVKHHIATLVRLANEVPFDDVMMSFQQFLKFVEETGTIVVPKSIPFPSTFVSKSLFAPINTTERPFKKIFIEIFMQTGRVSHLNRVLAMHPSYFDKFWAAFNFIMTEPGPLPVTWRNYIAILAVAQHKCSWLLSYQEQEFLLNGGEESWLNGIESEDIPKKLLSLLPINEILSHQPWLLTKEHIAPLVKGEDSWSIGELVQAIIIICTFNALSGIVHGTGVTDEVDWEGINYSMTEVQEEETVSSSNVQEANRLAAMLQDRGWATEESEEQPQDIFARAETESEQPRSGELRDSKNHEDNRHNRYIGKHTMQHVDFDMKSKVYSVFRVQDWNWKEDGFELARRFLPGAATLLDEEFDYIYSLTYNKFNKSQNIDTFPFRRAVWQYVQRIKGVFHDDYDYREVNVLLNKNAKSYIKKISCSPAQIVRNDFLDIGYELTPDEKIHVALLAVESSKQSALLYGIHAIMKHMYHS